MPLKLNVEIFSPLDANDHELLTGVSVMLLAISNLELAKERFPEAFDDETPAEEQVPPAPCGMKDNAGSACVGKVGHRGRHTFRPEAASEASSARVN